MISFANKIIILFFLLMISSCGQTVKFDPQFKVTSSESQGLFAEDGSFIHVSDPNFNNHYCMSEQKVLELWQILNELKRESPWMAKMIEKNPSYQKLSKSFRGWSQTN